MVDLKAPQPTFLCITGAMKIKKLLIVWVASVVLPAFSANAQQWDRFRGPNGTGVSLESELPTEWEESDYEWKIELAGAGSSSPVVWDDKLFILSTTPKAAIHLQCLDLESGDENWKAEFDSDVYKIHAQNSFASSSPAVDADHVYIAYANPESTMLVALNHEGEEVWKRNFGSWISQHGFGVSPIVYGELVIFFNSQQADRLKPGQKPGKSEMIAVNRSTGEDVWKCSLTPTRSCYAMPAIYEAEGKTSQLLGCNTGDGFFSIDPETGEKNWSEKVFPKRVVASTLLADGMVFGSSGSGGGGNVLVAAKINQDGIEKAHEINRSANYVPSPIAVNGMLFLFGDRGVVTCLDLKTGAEHWRQRVGSSFSGSPVATGTHVYCMDAKGTCFVIRADKEFNLVSEIDLGEPSRSTPTIVGNRLLLRTSNHLMSLQGPEPEKPAATEKFQKD